MSEKAPFNFKLEEDLPASTILATTVAQIGEAQMAGVLSSASYTPKADITGANSPASRTISIINKGQDGNGTTVMATLAFVSAVNASDYDERAFTLSSTPADLAVAQGDIIVASSAPVGGTGLVDPGGRIQLNFARS
jgi:hypothetical protein